MSAASERAAPRARRRTRSWPQIFDDYDLRRGRVWLVVLLWPGAGPAVVRALARRAPVPGSPR